MNLIDLYLKINSCERDSENNIYFISSNNEKKIIGVLEGHDIQNGVFKVCIKKFKKDTKFLNIITEEVVVDEE